MRANSSQRTSTYQLAEHHYGAAEIALPRKMTGKLRSRPHSPSSPSPRCQKPTQEGREMGSKNMPERINPHIGILKAEQLELGHPHVSPDLLPSSPPSLSHSPCSTPPSEWRDGSLKPTTLIGELTEANLRFATSVGLLRSMLHQHISSVRAAQAEHQHDPGDASDLAAGKIVQGADEATIRKQTTKRRFEGPRRRPRFCADRYRDLCEQALAEL